VALLGSLVMVLYYLTCFRATAAKFGGERCVQMIPVEAIERLIDDFRTRIEKLEPFEWIEYINGGMRAYETAIRELQKVVDDYGSRKS
jgi:hypothetical protein